MNCCHAAAVIGYVARMLHEVMTNVRDIYSCQCMINNSSPHCPDKGLKGFEHLSNSSAYNTVGGLLWELISKRPRLRSWSHCMRARKSNCA